MSLFKKATTTNAYAKVGFFGFAGSGKTYTAADFAIGLVKLMKSRGIPGADKPIYMLDSEGGSDWVKPMIEGEGIEFFTAKTGAFSDLIAAMPEAQREASVLIVDSLSTFWVEFTDTYRKVKKRQRGLEFQDWAYLKTEWRQKFVNPYLNAPVHMILCGRAGYEYDHYTDEAGKKQIEKSGVKMKSEAETGFEPSLVVLMERETDMETKKVSHVAHVLKDRRTDGKTLDGKTIKSPCFKHFLPHVEWLNLGGEQLAFDASRTSAAIIPADVRRENNATLREVVIEEIKNLLSDTFEGRSDAAQKAKREAIEKYLAPTWKEVESLMSLDELRMGFNNMHLALTGKPSRYFDTPEIDDALPETGGAPSGLAILLGKYAEAADLPTLNEMQSKAQAFLNDLSEGDREKVSLAYAQAAKRIIQKMSRITDAGRAALAEVE